MQQEICKADFTSPVLQGCVPPPHDFGDEEEEGDGISEDTFYLAKQSTVLLMKALCILEEGEEGEKYELFN